jgi:ribonuclease P protein component
MRTGRRAAGAGFVLVVAESEPREPVGPPRLGITVSRKVGSAVVRNRVKRQVREWFRGHRSGLARGLDVVVIGRAPAAGLPHRAVDAELCELVRKLSAEGVRE